MQIQYVNAHDDLVIFVGNWKIVVSIIVFGRVTSLLTDEA